MANLPRLATIFSMLPMVATGACASTVTPFHDAAPPDDGPFEAGIYFDSSLEAFDVPDGYVVPDILPRAPSNGRACHLGNDTECGPNAACVSARIRRRGERSWRRAMPGRCVDSPTLTVRRCYLDGTVGYHPPGMVCMGFLGEHAERDETALLTPLDCLRLREEALPQARPDEEVASCWFSDQTLATSPVYPGPGCPTTLEEWRMGNCALGCDCSPLSSFQRHCMFASATHRYGVCLYPTNPLLLLYMPCKATHPRIPCRRGEACLSPLRNDRDGIPDQERYGVCLETSRCRNIATSFRGYYLCDATLVEP